MIVNKVAFLNLDDLYSVVLSKASDVNYQKLQFKQHYGNLLSHIEVSFDVSEINRYEYMMMKQFASSISKFRRETDMVITERYVSESYDKMYTTAVKPFFAMLKEMSADTREELQKPGLSLFPSSFIIGKCTVSFTGNELIQLFGMNPLEFFVTGSDGACIIKNENDEEMLDPEYGEKINTDENIYNYMIQVFIGTFYKFLLNRFDQIDLASDSYIQNMYLNRMIKDQSVLLLTIRNPLLLINFLDDDQTVIAKKMKDTIGEYTSNGIDLLKDTYLEFGLNTSFGLFMTLYEVLPKKKFTSMESFGIPFRNTFDPSNSIPVFPIYKNRVIGRINTILNEVDNKYKDKNNKVKQIELTTQYVPYKYIVTLSLDDINTYLVPIISRIDEVSKPLSKSAEESYNIINNIITYARIIYNKLYE